MNKTVNFFFLLPLFFLWSCDNAKNEVVVYTSVDQVFSEPVLKAFEDKTGIKVKAVFDTEEAKSTGVLNRLIAEKENPQCDVFWSGDPMRAAVLKQKGITQSFLPEHAKGIDSVFMDKEYHWIGFSSRARVLLVNTDRIKEKDYPISILDLTHEKYKGKFAMANPLFGTTSFHIAALFTVLGDAKAKQFLRDLKSNNTVIATSNGDVKKKVARGEVALGLTDSDDANEAIKEGLPVRVLFLDQKGFGNLIVPNTVSLLKNAPNLINGKKLINYLVSVEVEQQLAKSCAQMPLHKNVSVPSDVLSLDGIIPMNIKYEFVAKKSEQIKIVLKKWVSE